jgi:two-component system, sensor histidine kinase and response regulator
MLNVAVSGGDTLLDMINDLLDVEKLGAGAMQLECVDVSIPEIIASSVMQVSSLAEGKQLSVVYDVADSLPIVKADPNMIRRIIVNLLANAIKFTPTNGRVTVAANRGSDYQSVNISVIDTGEGVPEESLNIIFEKFAQVATRRDGRTMSTGLGLAFCKLAVEAHGGQINASSDTRSGSAFTFTLPCGQM